MSMRCEVNVSYLDGGEIVNKHAHAVIKHTHTLSLTDTQNKYRALHRNTENRHLFFCFESRSYTAGLSTTKVDLFVLMETFFFQVKEQCRIRARNFPA
jgi:hypothetical protein